MGRTLGLFLLFLGALILLKKFYPETLTYLAPYAHYIKASFWGVALICLGLYLLSKNKAWRTTISAIFILYVALYLVVPDVGTTSWYSIGEWFGEKMEGEMHAVGEFQASELIIQDIVAETKIISTDGNSIKVTSNLPVQAEISGSTLILKCTEVCSRYKNGKLTVEVGKGLLKSLEISNTVGDYYINLEDNLSQIMIKNTVGRFSISQMKIEELYLSDFVGDFNIEIEECSQITMEDGIGDITIDVPSEYKVVPIIRDSATKIEINSNESGTKTLKLIVDSVIGRVKVS
ncbi:hypothetical protein VFC49_03080 [Thermococcus sp. SY098]|uniref:hypothetical protein n=1 Tax=Thermococcus sp. SY098 TaxID=3111325 RepID=UPI002D771B59|nr:hypothetical protein [Thermococcus sp. SY098]WRS53127.1 hypothetical protein VFC49_03080 [Thermococcus sp. SY098]